MAAGSAQAAFFSFGSDTSDQAWTFTGNGANITQGMDAAHPLTLHIDDNNGLAPRLDVSVSFTAQYTLTFVGNVPLPGGSQAMVYAANGSFTFNDVPGGVALLTTTFTNALFTTRADAAMTKWLTTGTLQVDDSNGATVSMVWGGANLPNYNLAPGVLNGSPRGFGFDMTAINMSGAIPYAGQLPGATLNANTHLPSTTWFSEGSYSATANVPTPGVAALLGLGGLVATRRRRA